MPDPQHPSCVPAGSQSLRQPGGGEDGGSWAGPPAELLGMGRDSSAMDHLQGVNSLWEAAA